MVFAIEVSGGMCAFLFIAFVIFGLRKAYEKINGGGAVKNAAKDAAKKGALTILSKILKK